MSRNTDVSKSYKTDTIEFDNTTPGAVDKGFTADTAQDAIEEAKAKTATDVAEGLVRKATPAEIDARSTEGYVAAEDLPTGIDNADLVYDGDYDIIAPTYYYATPTSKAFIEATYSGAPTGTIVVYNEQYQKTVGTGNGAIVVTRNRRAAVVKLPSGAWEYMAFRRDT